MATRYKAFFLDFYGTLVDEDDEIITRIIERIAATSPVSSDVRQIGRDWRFAELCHSACGDDFRTQRALELESLQDLLAKYQCDLDPIALSEELFAYWRSPRPYEDAMWFIQNLEAPVCIVSNIDTDDITRAIASLGWKLGTVVTSECCRSYKPRCEIFLQALDRMQCAPGDVLHIGDSLGSDVVGAQRLGMDVAWINRKSRRLRPGLEAPTYTVPGLRDLYVQIQR